MKKKLIGLAGAILAFGLIFTGCGETPDDNESDNQNQEQPQNQNGGQNSGNGNNNGNGSSGNGTENGEGSGSQGTGTSGSGTENGSQGGGTEGQTSGGGTDNGGGSTSGTEGENGSGGTSGTQTDEEDTKTYPYWDYTIDQGNTWNTIEISESTATSLKAIRKTAPISNYEIAEDMDLFNSYFTYYFKPEVEGTYYLSFVDDTEVEFYINDASVYQKIKVSCPVCEFIKVVDSKNNISSFIRTVNDTTKIDSNNLVKNILEFPIEVTKEMVETKVSVLLQSTYFDVKLDGFSKIIENINFTNISLSKEKKYQSTLYAYKPIQVESEVKRIAQDLSVNYRNSCALIDVNSYSSSKISFTLSENFYTNRNGIYAPNVEVLKSIGREAVKNFYYKSYAYTSQILHLEVYDEYYISFEDNNMGYEQDYFVDFEVNQNEYPDLSVSDTGYNGVTLESGKFYIKNDSDKSAEIKILIFPCKKGEYNIEFEATYFPVIYGNGNKYSIDYSCGEENNRVYKETNLNHAGGLVKVTIDENVPTDRYGGVMGFIFDLKNGENGKDFFIVAVRKNGYYVSKYSNVTNFYASNFGVSSKEDNTQEDGTTETEYAIAFQPLTLSIDENGNSYVYVYAYCNNDGSYDWKILNDKAADKANSLKDKKFGALDLTDDMILAEGTIPASETGYTKQTQNGLAVYANIYSFGCLVGNWDFIGTYK